MLDVLPISLPVESTCSSPKNASPISNLPTAANTDMKIYLAQHGLALNKALDPLRPLSPEGIEQSSLMAEWLRQQKILIRNICHSGKLRAEQTADIFSRTLKTEDCKAISGLDPTDDPAIIADNLLEDTLYVGHLPHLARLTDHLIGCRRKSPVVVFRNSAVICLTRSNESGFQIDWFQKPILQ
ncbi:MAG: phosphohistidine phosphatase SixA [Gammaproteobacteria bacterium]|nr:MAG: phosphohistidine phosphatase SixA [Gammaproteobacteria bacterium]